MAAAIGRRLLSTFPSLCGKLSGHQSIIVCYLKSVKKSLIRSYSNVGKSASFMMRSSRRAQQKRQDKQPKSKDIQHWMARTAGRGAKMATGVTDWPSVYSGAKSYHPSVVPVFFRMGRLKHNKPGFAFPMRALGNLQLMKIPNFFHLSPPAIEKHCEVLKPLCTEWPQAIDLSTVPLRITTRNYLFAGPSLYHPGSRKVKLQVYLKDLVLDDHARKKIISLVGPRYSAETDELTIVADRCPTRKQNKDYAMYLLTVLYHESWKTEPWETEASHEAEEEEDDEEGEKPKKKRKNPKRIRLINGKLYRMNQYGKYFKLKIKVKH